MKSYNTLNSIPIETNLDDALDNPSEKSLDEFMQEQDYDPEEELFYDEEDGPFPSLWDKR